MSFRAYSAGLDVLGGDKRELVSVKHVSDGWHEAMLVIGALASLATLWSVLATRRGRR